MLIYIYIDYAKDLSWFTTKLYTSNGKKKKKKKKEREKERERKKKKEEGLKEAEKTEDGELGPREK